MALGGFNVGSTLEIPVKIRALREFITAAGDVKAESIHSTDENKLTG